MMAFRTIALPNIMEVRQEVARVLIQQLGITKAAFYFRENFAQPTDGLILKEAQFGGKTALDIYQEVMTAKTVAK